MKKVLVVDIDGTVFRWHLIFLWLKELAAIYPQVREVIEQARPALEAHRARKGPFQAYIDQINKTFWMEKRFIGISAQDSLRAARAVVQRSGDRQYVFTRELIAAAKQMDWLVIAISGSPQEAVDAFADCLDIDHALGTVHPVDPQGSFMDGPITEYVTRKGEALQKFSDNILSGIDFAQSVGVGDTFNDAKMLERVGYPICFNPSGELITLAQRARAMWAVVVERKDVIYVQRPNDPGLHTAAPTLENILPMDLAEALRARLRKLPLITLA